MTTGNRYKSDPRRIQGKLDIYEYIEGQERRLRTGETAFRVGHTSIEDGDFIVRNGDIIVSESDDSIVMRLFHGESPAIGWYPLGIDSTHIVSMFAFDVGDITLPETAFQNEITETTAFNTDGGKQLMWPGGHIVSHTPDGGAESYMWFNILGNATIGINGIWPNNFQYSTEAAIYAGTIDVPSGFGSWTNTYLSPFASTMAPVVGLLNTAGALTWNLTAVSTSAFTVSWSGTLDKTLYFWNFRVA